MPITLLSN